MGTPGLGEGAKLLRVREVGEIVGAFDSAAHAEVPDGQHVGAAEVEHQEHVGGPATEALDGDEPGGDLLVGEIVQ